MVLKFADDRVQDDDERLTLRDLAREAMEQSGDDIGAAVDSMQGQVDDDEALFDAVVRPNTRRLFEAACMEVRRSVRRGIERQMANPDAGVAGLRLLARDDAVTLFDEPLMDGTPLGDAPDDLIARTRDFWRKRGKTYLGKAEWLDAILAEKPAGKTPREVFNLATLRRLREQAMEEGR